MKMAAFAFIGASILAIAACSQETPADQAATTPVADTTVIRAVPPMSREAPAAGSSAAAASSTAAPAPAEADAVPYLSDLLERADYAAAFKALAGAKRLPAWTRDGGTNTPAEETSVDGKTLLIAQGCKPHDCATERLVLAYDEKTHQMWGVFARARSDQLEASESNDELIWLGQPGEAIKAELKQWLYQNA
ncbi:hypothetical protein KK141_04875 [Dyella sp. LX-66]|uniref:Ivy family c-type lysozyme inhibitor n=1 Tax=unclassified Dyella TaxID=2634549 RepID=UPI001BE1263F|nr:MULTISPECIES: Ivy family c-type lysozyme inhibitor [unclassified Dyella]MBT2116948.1 hypothetical protein [Dyella sp. LX-1]MBT2138871.1 hypothetical protein [Dyella sp. LX-66]